MSIVALYEACMEINQGKQREAEKDRQIAELGVSLSLAQEDALFYLSRGQEARREIKTLEQQVDALRGYLRLAHQEVADLKSSHRRDIEYRRLDIQRAVSQLSSVVDKPLGAAPADTTAAKEDDRGF